MDYTNSAPNALRTNKVDMLSTKNQDMKLRRTINASPAQDSNDYTTLGQVNQLIAVVSSSVTSLKQYINNSINKVTTGLATLITSIIAPPSDSATAIVVTKADQKTPVLTFDTVKSRVEANGALYSFASDTSNTGLPAKQFLRMQFDPAGFGDFYGDIVSWDGVNGYALPLAVRSSNLTLGSSSSSGSKIAFFTSNQTLAVAQQVLNGYTSDPLSGAFVGIPNSTTGSVFAQVSDLNNLRVAYENLRVAFEDLRSKLQASTLIK